MRNISYLQEVVMSNVFEHCLAYVGVMIGAGGIFQDRTSYSILLVLGLGLIVS